MVVLEWAALFTAFGLGAFVSFAAMRLKMENMQAAHLAEIEAVKKSMFLCPSGHRPNTTNHQL